MFFTKSLRVKTLLSALIPITLVLVAAAVIGLYSYDRVARDVVKQRDAELARISAARLSENLSRHSLSLQNLAAADDVRSLDPARLSSALKKAQSLLNIFDGGLVVYNSEGKALWSQPVDAERLGADIPARSELDKVRRTLRPAFSNIFQDQVSGGDVILIGVPIIGGDNEFNGVLAGMSNIKTSLLGATFANVLELKAGRSGYAYLVDGNGRVVYHRQTSLLGTKLAAIEPVIQVTRGETGAVVTEDPTGEQVISGFAPVQNTGWGVITQESWQSIVGPIQDRSWLLLALLVAGGVITGLLIYFAIGRILKPVKALTRGAQRIAGGDFGHTISANTGDEIQALAEQFNTMAGELKESYEDLEQKVAEQTEELAQSEERYRTLFEESRDAIFVSLKGKVVATNQAALDLFGFTLEESIGSDVGDRYVDPADQERFRQEVQRRGFVRDFEVKLTKKDGTQMDCLLTASRRLSNDGGTPGEIQGLVRDITERRKAEEALLQQMQELAVLEERNRMAREIHDTLAQGFTGIVLQLEAAEQALEETPSQVTEHLSRAKNLGRESLQEARRSVWDLIPQALEQLSLETALREEVLRFDTQGRENASFSLSGAHRELPPNVQTTLLRICQESLTNVRKHSEATEVGVRLAFYPDAVGVEVHDNGVGADFQGVRVAGEQGGFGLISMQQRAWLVGGLSR